MEVNDTCRVCKKEKSQRCVLRLLLFRAESGTRTRDLRITNALLYQLSYFGEPDAKVIHFFELANIKRDKLYNIARIRG